MTGFRPPQRADRPDRDPRRGGGLAILIVLVQTVGTTFAARGQSTHLDLLGYALLVVGGLGLANRRRRPVATFLVVTGATGAYYLLDYPAGPTFLALIIATVTVMNAGHHRLAWATAIAWYATWAMLTGATLGRALGAAAWVVGFGLLTEFVLYAAPFVARGLREQRRLHEERQRRQAIQERLRIAQELHDVLGHHLSLINVRAGVGLHLMHRQPDEARIALDTIKEASAEALREVQSVLNTLYPSEAAPRAPAPGLERLDDLTVNAGLSVHTTISGEPRPLPAEIDRAAYRIVQEALTNVRRHAGPAATATIVIDYQREDAVVVQVEDNGGTAGPVSVPAVEGNGISGMRERATTLGGSLTAQPMPDGGWRVRALLPLPAAEPDGTR
jgi:signal transduction histidine kinase